MNRQPHGDAPLSTQLAILLAAAFAVLAVWALPDLIAWMRGEPPVTAELRIQSCRDDTARANGRAIRYARLISGCLNGQAITDGEHVAPCREPR